MTAVNLLFLLATCIQMVPSPESVGLCPAENDYTIICVTGAAEVDGVSGDYTINSDTKPTTIHCFDKKMWDSSSSSTLGDGISCKITQKALNELMSQRNSNLLKNSCNVVWEGSSKDFRTSFDTLELITRKSDGSPQYTTIAKAAAEDFKDNANCAVRIAAKWMTDNICIIPNCGSTNQNLQGFISWSATESTPASCQALVDDGCYKPNGVFSIQPTGVPSAYPVYCEDGWTLLMKVNGSKQTFRYNESVWTSDAGLNTDSADKDNNEAVLLSYAKLPITRLRIEMVKDGEDPNELEFALPSNVSGSNLHAIIAGSPIATNVSKDDWKNLVPGSSLQEFCNKQGFNQRSDPEDDRYCQVRIGILSNNQEKCGSPNSFVGIGPAGTAPSCPGQISSGNVNDDTVVIVIPTFTYVYGKYLESDLPPS